MYEQKDKYSTFLFILIYNILYLISRKATFLISQFIMGFTKLLNIILISTTKFIIMEYDKKGFETFSLNQTEIVADISHVMMLIISPNC